MSVSPPAQDALNELPLRCRTPAAWATHALSDPLALLNDHAHLEKKAAANALDLLSRWPDHEPPQAWVTTMTSVARDEVDHLGTVVRLLNRYGGAMSRTHQNPYAAELRRLVRLGAGPLDLMDRLMVSALIEARSCERFAVLAEHCADARLAGLYRGLWRSEAGHFQVFLNLCELLPDACDTKQRWDHLLDEEARILAAQAPGPRMHSGSPTIADSS